MKGRNIPKKSDKKKKSKKNPASAKKDKGVEIRYHVNQHLPKYFRMTADDMKELEGCLDEIYGKSDK
jgi:hypothetical protein